MTSTDFQNDAFDDTEYYATKFRLGDKPSSTGKGKVSNKQRKADNAVKATLTETAGLEAGFKTTYKPARFEEGWLLSSLETFYDRLLISDVLMRVKGGKEANVYLCQADPASGFDLVAAKVYRPRGMRNLRNDWLYREGREIAISASGVNRRRADRVLRALKNKSEFGKEIAHSSWINHENGALDTLNRLGGAVPKPIATGENALLMGYLGDRLRAAPPLHEVTLDSQEVAPLFFEVMRNIELMLQNGMIHGDLSAYNILYWEGKITLIDFPQVTMSASNPSAYMILTRDVQRVCEYFATQGLVR
ncbi:MAG TPA: RIO1 family regulatory kinase/ATPase, partial [Caldilineaceae bacterium]|nr:RIO1 family regulatory kinase/ATPase [Caldilineaceae bacterium]